MAVRQLSSQSKGALVWGAVFLILVNLGLVVAMETSRPELCDPEYGLRLTRLRQRLTERMPGQSLVCALGSSRVAMGLRPDRMSGTDSPMPPLVFNYSIMAGGPLMELCYLRRLLADRIDPDWLLVEVWPPYLLHDQGEWAEENRFGVERLRRRDLTLFSRYVSRPKSLWRRWATSQVQPWLTHRIFLLSLYAPEWLPLDSRLDPSWTELDDHGWLEKPWGEPDPEMRQTLFEKGRGILKPALNHFHVGAIADRALRELVTVCRQEKIGLVLIFLPESSECRSWYPPEAQAEVDQYLRRLSRECAVPVVNARPWIADEKFFDGYHLTNQGAAAFSEQVEQRVLQPLLAGRPIANEDLWPIHQR